MAVCERDKEHKGDHINEVHFISAKLALHALNNMMGESSCKFSIEDRSCSFLLDAFELLEIDFVAMAHHTWSTEHSSKVDEPSLILLRTTSEPSSSTQNMSIFHF